MTEIIGIRFGESGKTYCFRAEDMEIKKGDRVVVESELGINIGNVIKTDYDLTSSDKEIKPVLRKVTEADIRQEEENLGVKDEALRYCRERIEARGMSMKVLTANLTLDRKRFIFYFVAEARIDFRDLVKDLASKFRARIELRQIGVRDAAKIAGGFGVCGKEFCCKTFLKSFAPISIKMAKQQELVLNTSKLSGACGRLMCCLGFEYLNERELKEVREQEAQERKVREQEAQEQEAQEQEVRAQEAQEQEVQERESREKRALEAVGGTRNTERAMPDAPPSEKRGQRRSRSRWKAAHKTGEPQKAAAAGVVQQPPKATEPAQQEGKARKRSRKRPRRKKKAE